MRCSFSASNPVFTAPADLNFAEALGKVDNRIHLGLYVDETAEQCHWHMPEAHYLESWGDVRSFDGTVSLIQPLIAPIYDGRTAIEVLAALNGTPGQSPMDLVKEYWTTEFGNGALRNRNGQAFSERGFVLAQRAARRFPPRHVDPWWRCDRPRRRRGPAAPAPAPKTGLEIIFRPDPHVLDGRFANNAWLQELPKPLSKVTWDNVVYVSPKTAEAHGIRVPRGQRQPAGADRHLSGPHVRRPVWVMPGTADDVVVVHFGYGRKRAGRVGNGIGANAFPLRTSAAPWFDGGAEITLAGQHVSRSRPRRTTSRWKAAIRCAWSKLEEYRKDPKKVIAEHGPHLKFDKTLTLYPVDHPHGENAAHRWGMAIDLNACTGCGVCIAACVAENNIPVVGKMQVGPQPRNALAARRHVLRGRRRPRRTGTYHQPVPCMQCENAPCEVVCPVAATVHSDEGLNDMVYNRCVGTRYCSNNCPYKVRRFNFLLYSDFGTPELYAQRNPDVTIRSRGVMEKCTYCVQRINYARIDAKTAGREIADGKIKTACQQACPADAIIFGDLNQAESRVVKLKAQERNYSLLEDLGTRPRTTYLAVVRTRIPLERGAAGLGTE